MDGVTLAQESRPEGRVLDIAGNRSNHQLLDGRPPGVGGGAAGLEPVLALAVLVGHRHQGVILDIVETGLHHGCLVRVRLGNVVEGVGRGDHGATGAEHGRAHAAPRLRLLARDLAVGNFVGHHRLGSVQVPITLVGDGEQGDPLAVHNVPLHGTSSLGGAGNVEILHGAEGEGALHLASRGLQGGLVRQGAPTKERKPGLGNILLVIRPGQIVAGGQLGQRKAGENVVGPPGVHAAGTQSIQVS